VIERIAFRARGDKRIDQRSGVSQRMPITVLESVVSNAERRAVLLNEERAVPRISDIYASLPAITGKMELEYEGELHGHDKIARELIAAAAHSTFEEHAGGADVEEIVEYFEQGGALQLGDDSSADVCIKGFDLVPGLSNLIETTGLAPSDATDGERVAACELVLEALVAERRVSRSSGGGYRRTPHGGGPGDGPGPGGSTFDPFGGLELG